jgi:ubiquinone/menaquinone biosynthesis methyltransferase
MTRIMSEAVKNIFDDISPTYDRLNHMLSLNIDKKWRKKTVGLIQKKKDDDFKVLDLCAGTYDLSIEILRQFPNCQVTAADFSQSMLDVGRPKIQNYLNTGQIKPVCCDALNMPFDADDFDVILCGYGVRNFDHTEKGILEIKRVLKPGGQILVLEFFRPKNLLTKIFHKTYAGFVIPTLGRWVSGNSGAYAYLRDSIQGFITLSEFKNILNKNSFKHIKNKDFILAISSAVSAFKTDTAV